MQTDMCSTNAQCLNTAGSYTCRCTEGTRGDGYICNCEYWVYTLLSPCCNDVTTAAICCYLVVDSDDCLEGSCGDNSYCSGVQDGKSVCMCQPGYGNIGSADKPSCQGLCLISVCHHLTT